MQINHEQENLLNQTQELVDNLKNSTLYKNYINAKQNLIDQKCLDKLREYKQAHLAFYATGCFGFEREKNLSSLYSKLILNKQARDFLLAELALTHALKKIYELINGSLEIDLFD